MSTDQVARARAAGTDALGGAIPTLALMLLPLVAACCLFFWPTLRSLHASWTDTDNLTYTHGYLIVALCLWMFWRAAREAAAPGAPLLRLLPAVAGMSVLSVILYRAGIEVLFQLLFPALLASAICAVMGFRAGRHFLFPCAFLVFAIPVWDFGNGILQAVSVLAVKTMLQLSGISAFVDGNVMHIPEGVFVIEGGCSGLHFFIVALAIAALFGEINRDSLVGRIKLLLLGAVLAILCNWIRIYIVVVAGHLTEMQHYLVRVSHYYFGWALFAATTVVFFWLAGRMPLGREPDVETAATLAPVPASRAIRQLAPGIAALAVGPLLALLLPVRGAPATCPTVLPSLGGWEGPAAASTSWSPVYPDSDCRQLALYRRNGAQATVFVAAYDQQRQGKEMIGYGHSLFEGLGTVADERLVTLPGGEARAAWLAGSDPSLVVYYYETGFTRTARPIVAQLSYAVQTFGGPVPSRIVAAQMSCDADCESARQNLGALLKMLRETTQAQP